MLSPRSSKKSMSCPSSSQPNFQGASDIGMTCNQSFALLILLLQSQVAPGCYRIDAQGRQDHRELSVLAACADTEEQIGSSFTVRTKPSSGRGEFIASLRNSV
jgi:hypothetical protein